MTRKLEEEFNLPHLDEMEEQSQEIVPDPQQQIAEVQAALSISDKINGALAEVRGMEAHDSEMDDIAAQAVESYEQLMSLGMNMTDMAAGPVFSNAAAMLKIALEAKDSKTTRKLKQIDLMLKKANLDERAKKNQPAEDLEDIQSRPLDRNELLKILNNQDK
jgi:hypothetical protein